jgi:hypothetical protein
MVQRTARTAFGELAAAFAAVLAAVLVMASCHARGAQAQDPAGAPADMAAFQSNWHEVRGGAWAVPADVLADMAFHVVFDGGNCFFDAAYDPSQHRFTEFAFHGHA